MVIKNYRDIKKRATTTLQSTRWSIKKTVLLYGGIPLLLTLLLTGLELMINNADTAGGLAGIQTYGILSTVFTVAQLAASFFQLFWAPGILFCGLLVMRDQNPWPGGLFQGFRRWMPLLRFSVLVSIVFFLVYMIMTTGVSFVVVFFWAFYITMTTPVPQTQEEMITFMESMANSPTMETLANIVMVISMVIIALMCIPLVYRLRFVYLLIMDEPQMGARQAIATSFRLTKGSSLQLFLMDLSFWWYYLLVFLGGCIPFLSYLPIFNSLNEGGVLLALTAVQCVALLGIYLLGMMKVNTADAAAYCHLQTPEEAHDI